MSNHSTGKWLEHVVASDIGGRLQPGSGCLPFAKGDVINDIFLVECKASIRDGIRIPYEWILKIKHHAQCHERLWALAVGPRMQYTDNYYVLVPEEMIEDATGYPHGAAKGLTIEHKLPGEGPWIWRDTPWGMMTRIQFRDLNKSLLERLSLSPDKKQKFSRR